MIFLKFDLMLFQVANAEEMVVDDSNEVNIYSLVLDLA